MAQLKGIMPPPCKNPIECYKRCKNGAFPCINPNQKVYTHNPCGPLSKNHALVIAAYQKGLTGIRIIKGLGKGAARTGWTLECDQIPRLHLGYEITEAENRITKISI
jgi:hypothetical protein